MPWVQGRIELVDGSIYSGSFYVKEDRQLDEVFRPESNRDDLMDDDELVVSQVTNPRSPYQHPES